MFVRASVIRCKKCTRLFSDYADNCPDCLARTPRGWIKVFAPVVAIIITMVVLIWAFQVLQAPQ